MGNWGSIILTAIVSIGLVYYILPETMTLRGHEFTKWGVLGAIAVGLIVGALMSIITEYYTAMGSARCFPLLNNLPRSCYQRYWGAGCRYGINLPPHPGTGGRYLWFL